MTDKKTTSYSSLKGFRRAIPIILVAVALFIGLCFVTQESGSVGRAISGVLLGLFSWGAYSIPVLIALHALFYPSDVGEKRVVSRIIFSAVAVVSLSAFAHVVKFWQNNGVSFNIAEFYKNGQAAIGGGAIGSTVGFGIIKALGSVGLVIVAATVFAIYITYFFSRGQKGISRFFYNIAKGIVYFGAWVEKGVKKLFGKAKSSKEEKAKKIAEEKNRELMEDDFFDVDNGIEKLEISELGISEERDRASVEEHATLRDSVHHKSSVSAEEAAEMDRKARERAAASAAFYEGATETDGSAIYVEPSAPTEDKPVYEVKDSSKKTDESADDIFTAEFDPYELAMSEKLASKPSSRSLLDDKPAVREDISSLTEEDAERARKNADFERRKAAIVASRKDEPALEHKSVEYKTEEEAPAEPTPVSDDGVSVVIDKPAAEPEVKPVYTPESPYVYSYGTPKAEPAPTEAYDEPVAEEHTPTAPTVTYSEPATAYSEPTRTEPTAPVTPTASESGARAAYRRAAEFAAMTIGAEEKPEAPTAPVVTYAEPTVVEPTPVASYTEPAKSEPAPTVTYAEPVKSEPAPAVTYEEPSKSEPRARTTYSYEDDEDDEDVYTPSFTDSSASEGGYTSGEYSTAEEDSEGGTAEFKDYSASEDDGGLVFEFDMGKSEEPKVLVTESVHYGDEDDEDEYDEDVTEVDEVVEEDGESEEIPPEKRNPFVSEMRDMFPALRVDAEEPDEATAEDDVGEIDEEDEETPPFDEPTTVPPVAPTMAKAEKKEEPKPKAKPNYKNYKKPPLELMELEEVHDSDEISHEIRENTNIIIETLASFNVTASIKGVDRGPRITRYEVVPAKGVKVNQITNLLDNITMNLAAEGIRMEAPIPGKSAIGFEIPNKNPVNVRLRELLECEEFINAKSNTFVCIGKDVAGHPVFGDIAKFPHALVAGATGMGKSVCINSIMISLLYKARPDQIKFIMIDPKKVEFRMYSGIPHLLIPVITDAKQAAGALMWAVDEMERRYDLIEKLNIRNIEAYNEKQAIDPSIGEHMPKIVIVIDELNDLMMQVRDPVEGLIMRIAQKARAAGIHLIIGTQRPDVKVITGTIKANINTRISCKVTSVVDSRTILEMAGAEKLLNRGDMLFKPVDKTKPIRVQGAFVSDNEVEAIMEFLKSQGEGAQYDDEIYAEINKAAQKCGNKKSGGGADADDDDGDDDVVGYYNDQKFLDAVELAIRQGKISTSLLQRKMSIGYGKAAKYIDAMEEIGVVSEPNGQKPRDVLITMDQWYDKLSRVDLG